MNKRGRSDRDLLIASALEEASIRAGLSVDELKRAIIAEEDNNRKIAARSAAIENALRERMQASKDLGLGMIPAGIINHPELSPLEVMVKYLKEEQGLKLREIALLCGRDERAIGVTYRRSVAKAPQRLSVPANIISSKAPRFPISILKDESLSVLEHIVIFLLDRYCTRLHDVAVLLGKDDRTIWTIRERAQKKLTDRKQK